MNRILLALLINFWKLLLLLPKPMHKGLIYIFGNFIYLMPIKRNKISKKNIDLCFPHLSGIERKRLHKLNVFASAKVIFESYKKYSDSQIDWTNEQRESYLEKGRLAEIESERKLKDWKSNSKYFIDLLKSILGTLDLKILKITVPKDKKNQSGFPFHEMNFTWGWDFDIFILSSKKKKVILHLGNVLT